MRSPIQETNIPGILAAALPREYQAAIREHQRLSTELCRIDEYAAFLRRVARAAGVALVPSPDADEGGAAS